MAWTGLTAGQYTMYMAVSDDNPFDTATFGPIHSYPITPEVPAWERFLLLGILTLLMLIF
jgi:hypothetical protein